MTPRRLLAGIAAILTALILQATLIAPLTIPVPVSLPAVLVAAVALASGPSTGIAFGFTAGLFADLGSEHPAGVLALGWLGVGVLCGVLGGRISRLRETAPACGIVCGLTSGVVSLLLTALGSSGATVWLSARDTVPAALGDGLLALWVVPAVRVMLRTEALRAQRAILSRSAQRSPAGRHG
jgi:rod shape-determining protein MreD